MECPRCHNRNVNRLYKLNGKYYCRECIAFHRVFVDEKIVPEGFQYPSKAVQYHLDFELSASQKQISRQLVENYQNQLHSLVLAVCGFRVIIVTVANSLGNIRVFELLPKLKTKKYGWCIA